MAQKRSWRSLSLLMRMLLASSLYLLRAIVTCPLTSFFLSSSVTSSEGEGLPFESTFNTALIFVITSVNSASSEKKETTFFIISLSK